MSYFFLETALIKKTFHHKMRYSFLNQGKVKKQIHFNGIKIHNL